MPWRDVLHDGPVPGGLTAEALAEVRAAFIVRQHWATLDEVRKEFAARDAALARAADHDEVVLWFEHDLYDQLQLIQVLDRFRARPAGTRLTIICRAEYLGPLPEDRGPELFAARVPVTAEMTDLAGRAWGAFTARNPTRVTGVIASETGALPFLRAALIRLLEEYPWTTDGLSRMERQALVAVREGASTEQEAFLGATSHEDPLWCGDASFHSYLDRLAGGPTPLLQRQEGALALTDACRDVLSGKSDAVRLNGIDRWLGGVHLVGAESPWRWDPVATTLATGSAG